MSPYSSDYIFILFTQELSVQSLRIPCYRFPADCPQLRSFTNSNIISERVTQYTRRFQHIAKFYFSQLLENRPTRLQRKQSPFLRRAPHSNYPPDTVFPEGSQIYKMPRVVSHWCPKAPTYSEHEQFIYQYQVVVKLHGVFSSNCEQTASLPPLQIRRVPY